ncbi:hypothetical protein JRQ81_016967 [Phrynocephalus forsythii]|uniref:Mitochondrial ribosomal protein L1 n=1 Tax=Phrynocephalus forsythii TaxID=171643 RepID=A0A9Q0XTV8_9SAUR|nr:hypothetical protein JRQ81_016967 [Phrynocephalus forsythii]
MAAPTMRCCLKRVLVQRPSHLFSGTDCHSSVVPCFGHLQITSRYYAKKQSMAKPKKRTLEPRINRILRLAPPLPSEPKDDVYLTWCYQRPIYEAEVALNMLKKFQQLEFVSPNQPVYAKLALDMALDKKKVVPFVATILFPHCFRESVNKVVVFTENAEEAAFAREYGADFVGATELISPILNGEITADYYVSVPSMLTKLKALRGTLNTKFPKTRSGSVGFDIPQMVNFFRLCHEYVVINDNLIETPIATLDMPNDQILANLDALIKDVCKYKPLHYGPFVTSLILQSLSGEGLLVKVEPFLPKGAVKKKVEKEAEEKAEEKNRDVEEEEMQKAG